MDKYKIDSHKLHYHLPRVNRWLAGETIYPIYMEISPSGMCNHRCSFCALDFMEYKKRFLDTEIMIKRFAEMGSLGLKSIMFAGEGEPLLHKEIDCLARSAKQNGIDVAFTTNGVFLKPEVADSLLGVTEWIKVSINAGTPETYSKLHGTKETDFNKVIRNLEYAAGLRAKNNCSIVLGMQILLLPENRNEISILARLARDIGMDYLVIKPYSQHPKSNTERYKNVSYQGVAEIQEEVAEFVTDSFQPIVRKQTIKNWNEGERGYGRCLALPFWSYLDSSGNIWGCSMFLGEDNFFYGNIHESSFQEIWEGEKRRCSLHYVEKEMDARECRVNCRMDKVNQYLWDLKHPPSHLNFI